LARFCVLTVSTAALAQSYYDDQACRQFADAQVAPLRADDYNGVAVWRRIRDAVAQLTNKTPPGPVH
jgi:leucyl aminopeptidase (aminopeptidase T)